MVAEPNIGKTPPNEEKPKPGIEFKMEKKEDSSKSEVKQGEMKVQHELELETEIECTRLRTRKSPPNTRVRDQRKIRP